MRHHWTYLKWLLRHKWLVFKYCRESGIWWRGITHDLSKFRPSEWFPYVDYIVRHDGLNPQKNVSYKVSHSFLLAFHHHCRRNDHHWQYWAFFDSHGRPGNLEMALDSMEEMVADWRAMSEQKGDDVWLWYQRNRMKMSLHPLTRQKLDQALRRSG